MAAQISVAVGNVTLRTVGLTKKILQQIDPKEWGDLRKLAHLWEGNKFKRDVVVGWIHPTVLGDYNPWLIIQVDEGHYARLNVTADTAKQFEQIYIV